MGPGFCRECDPFWRPRGRAPRLVPVCGFAYEGAWRMATSSSDPEDPMNEAAPAPEMVSACVVIIGNEILSGRTQDANLAFLAQGLNEVGVRLREARVIPDDTETIVANVNEARAKFDY